MSILEGSYNRYLFQWPPKNADLQRKSPPPATQNHLTCAIGPMTATPTGVIPCSQMRHARLRPGISFPAACKENQPYSAFQLHIQIGCGVLNVGQMVVLFWRSPKSRFLVLDSITQHVAGKDFAVLLPEHVLQHLPGQENAIILTGHVLGPLARRQRQLRMSLR